MKEIVAALQGSVRDCRELISRLTSRVEKLERPEFIDVVNLTTAQSALIGKYRAGAEHVVLVLDAALGAFNVQLPAARDQRNVIFIVKKIDGTANAVTLKANGNEFIFDTAKTNTLIVTDATPFNLVSDRVDTWLKAG